MDNGPRGVRRVVTIVGFAVSAAFVWVVVATIWLWRHQEQVVFQPPAVGARAPDAAQRVDFRASDGHDVFGYVVSPSGQTAPPTGVVIAFHGNADLAVWLIPWARELADRAHVTVLLPEYRGYADIPGQPTYGTAAADARGALRFAREHLTSGPIALFGHSLGTAVAAELAAEMEPEAISSLILQSPFTSAREMATRL